MSRDLHCLPPSPSHPTGPLPSHCPHRFNWKAGAPLGWGIPGRGPPRGSSWSGVGVGESPKAPSTVTPAGDRSVSGCWLSSCLRAPCCPEGLRRFWLRSQLVHQKERDLTNSSTLYVSPASLVKPASPSPTPPTSPQQRHWLLRPGYSFCFPVDPKLTASSPTNTKPLKNFPPPH